MIEYKIYHYCMEDFNDIGFGCSYRNIQTILSAYKKYYKKEIIVPNIRDIFLYFDKSYKEKINTSKTMELWIEPYNIYQYLKNNYNLNGTNLIYFTRDDEVTKILKTDITVYFPDSIYGKKDFDKLLKILINHFNQSKLPIVIDNGVYSYCIGNISNNSLLLIDPHTTKDDNTNKIKDIYYLQNSFWMIYLPIIE